MHTASPAPRDPHETLDGFLGCCSRIAELGYRLSYSHLDDDHVYYDDDDGIVHFRRGSTLAELTVAAGEIWRLLAIGPEASTMVEIVTPAPLYLVS